LSSDLDDDFSVAGTVELTKENALPCAENKGLAFYDYLSATANYRALHMGIGIAFGMAIAGMVIGYQLLEGQKNIVRYGRVGVFVYGDSSGRVRTINYHIPITNP
jgi:hypothetical protein